jgi:hypothetical protein
MHREDSASNESDKEDGSENEEYYNPIRQLGHVEDVPGSTGAYHPSWPVSLLPYARSKPRDFSADTEWIQP